MDDSLALHGSTRRRLQSFIQRLLAESTPAGSWWRGSSLGSRVHIINFPETIRTTICIRIACYYGVGCPYKYKFIWVYETCAIDLQRTRYSVLRFAPFPRLISNNLGSHGMVVKTYICSLHFNVVQLLIAIMLGENYSPRLPLCVCNKA